MKIIFTSFLFALLIVYSKNTIAQSKATPSATITYKTPPKADPFLEKIKEFTDADDLLTEKVIYQIDHTKTQRITKVVSDEEFEALTATQQLTAIKESEVVAIVNNLKK